MSENAPYRDKSHFGRASQASSCDQALTVFCIFTQFARENLRIFRFRGSCMREYDLGPVYMEVGDPR